MASRNSRWTETVVTKNDPLAGYIRDSHCDRVMAAPSTVIVDGKVCMEGGVVPGVDFAALRSQAQAAAEQVWDTLAEWDPLGRTAEQASPWSYPMGE